MDFGAKNFDSKMLKFWFRKSLCLLKLTRVKKRFKNQGSKNELFSTFSKNKNNFSSSLIGSDL